MAQKSALQPPNFIVGPDGRPTAIVLGLATWESIVARLEEREDEELVRRFAPDLAALAQGRRPSGWKRWEAFEAELDAAQRGP